jgi:hypothetical protein
MHAVSLLAHQIRIDKLAEERRVRGELDEENEGLDFSISDEEAFDEVDGDIGDGDEEDWAVDGEDELELGDLFDDDDDGDEDDQGSAASINWDDDEDVDSLFQYIK